MTLATAIATGTFRGINESLSEIVGFPVDRIGVFADIVAGTLAFWNWRRHKHNDTKGAH